MTADRPVLVTGASGFVGGRVAALLCERGERVRLLVRPTSDRRNLRDLPAEPVVGDLCDPASLDRALAGCRQVYHVAADYRLWSPDPRQLYRSNVQGTRNLLEAARRAGVERVVYTSSVGALGIPADGTPGHEETPVTLADMIGHYKRSKFLAEAEARASAQTGFPVVIVNPSTPVGVGDLKPTPTGRLILDFLNGRMPAYVETGLNLVDVEDVAEGHLLAMAKGRVGERYILGNGNLTMREILEILARITGRAAPTVRLPRPVVLGLGAVSTLASRVTGRSPRIPWEGVRMSGKKMFFDSSKAVRELGLPQTPVETALRKAVDWFRENGYLTRHNGH
ncbi:MAG: NAD-dependent dehydratase [Candidatus Omnitrophica bacterium CG11_big_fil_rev_8_21_14_0_20_64_10]|nr:MAG: NAD-dependent dehydratase [Candidatus Omnitrophica bacterium CG11_big_fil_rev_8_21_14_0_20_64_10]